MEQDKRKKEAVDLVQAAQDENHGRIGRKIDIKSLSLSELTDEVTAGGEKAFRARQMYQWIH